MELTLRRNVEIITKKEKVSLLVFDVMFITQSVYAQGFTVPMECRRSISTRIEIHF